MESGLSGVGIEIGVGGGVSQRRRGDKKDLFHVIHKVPSSDSPYGRAKHLQVLIYSLFI